MSVHLERQKTLIGGIVLLATFAFVLTVAMTRVVASSPKGAYDIEAVFNRADGIGLRSEVRLSGIRVGKVVDYRLDDQYRAVVTMRLDLEEELPDDALAAIQTEGLFGGKYIELTTGGGGFGTIASGERLDYTQDSILIEELLEKVVAIAKTRRGMDPDIPAAEQANRKNDGAPTPGAQPIIDPDKESQDGP